MNALFIPAHLGLIYIQWNLWGELVRVSWSPERQGIVSKQILASSRQVPKGIQDLSDQLKLYFYEGKPLEPISSLAIESSRWTEFQHQVYTLIQSIPHGETRSYLWVAEKLGNPNLCRAIGQALKRNPLMIWIPCHRVIRHSGESGGFMGECREDSSAFQLKEHLIHIENRFLNPIFPFVSSFYHQSTSLLR